MEKKKNGMLSRKYILNYQSAWQNKTWQVWLLLDSLEKSRVALHALAKMCFTLC